MRPSSAKAKGRRVLQWFVDRMLERFPDLTPDDIRVTSSGTTGEDVQQSPAARAVLPFALEGKNQEKLGIWAALKQAEGHREDYPGALVFKRNHSEVYFALRAEDFLDLLEERWRLMGGKTRPR